MLLYPFPCSYLAPSFFFNDTATTEIYTLSLHDALPISLHDALPISSRRRHTRSDRKSTRLNSSHDQISYAVFCLKKKERRVGRSEEHTSELQSRSDLVSRLLLEKTKRSPSTPPRGASSSAQPRRASSRSTCPRYA